MTQEAKPRWQVLRDFTATIYRYDIMGTQSPKEDEYEGEALSILARFTETALHMVEDQEALLTTANDIVIDAFGFWFDELTTEVDFGQLTRELLDHYIASYPPSEESLKD